MVGHRTCDRDDKPQLFSMNKKLTETRLCIGLFVGLLLFEATPSRET